MNRLFNKANKRLSLSNAAMLLISTALAAQVLGFFRNRLVIANFTRLNPGSTDSFFAAFQIPDFFFLTIAAGALGVAFMPVLADHLFKNDKKGISDLTSSLLNTLAIVMLIISAFIFIFAHPLLHYVVAPKLAPQQLHDAVLIMRIVALNPLLFTMSGIITSVQQTYGRFFFYAIAPLSYNLSIIASIYIFKNNLGVVGLGVGALIGATAQLLIASLGLFGLGFKYKPKINFKSNDFKLILRKLPPRSVDQGIDSINSIVETNRATTLGSGAVSYYNFATTLMNVPVMLFGTSIATAAFPRLTDKLAQGRQDLFHQEFFKVMQVMIWIAMPVSVVSYFARGYLARLLFGDVAPQVALIFGFLTVAIFSRIIYTIVSRFYYAQKDTVTPLLVSLFAIGLNVYLVFHLATKASYDIAGLALAQSIVAASEVFILMFIMLVRDPYIFNMKFWGAIGRIISVTGFAVVACFIMVSVYPLELGDRGFITLGIKFGAIAGVTLFVYVVMSALFGLVEAKIVIKKLRNLIFRSVRVQ
ncbi:MAG: murein biosynthesis integral membrane protein MurJ [Candidatus Saccharimonadales bacterium]